MNQHATEGARLASTLLVAHGQLKAIFALNSSGIPRFLLDVAMAQPAQISVGDLGALCLDIFFLYDKCAKAGVVDENAVDAEYLSGVRDALKEIKDEGVRMSVQSAEEALTELHSMMKHVCDEMSRRRAKMPAASDVIDKARKP